MSAELRSKRLSLRGRRVTITDLAAHLDLAKGTVSRAMNGYPDISETTRRRVQRAAEKLGYRPMSHAQAIRTGRVKSIGLVLQINEHDGHRPFVADFLAGLSKAASDEDWTLTVATASSDEDTLRLLEKLAEERKTDGFILPRTKSDDPRVAFLKEHDIPFVLFGRTNDAAGCAWFDVDGEGAMEQAVCKLARFGHRRIGFVPGAAGYKYSELRQKGYETGLLQCDLPFDPELVTKPAVNNIEGAEATRALLNTRDPATAIVYAVDHAAIGAYTVAMQNGMRIGRDLSLISYDGVPEGALIEPPLSTYLVDNRAAGEQLAKMLIRICRGEDPEASRVQVPAVFLDRGSHGPAPNRTE